MSPPDGSSTLTLANAQTQEERMRTAPGVVQDEAQPEAAEVLPTSRRETQVPPTIASARRSFEASDGVRARLAALESALATERSERVAAQRALADAQTTIQQLQTKLAHTEMAAAEALAAERQALLAAQLQIEDLTPSPSPKLPEKPPGTKKRGRPFGLGKQPAAENAEPEPVQWWLPSYKASKAKRTTRSRS